MFFSQEILTKKNGFSVIWLAATLGPGHARGQFKKLSKRDVNSVDVPKACDYLVSPNEIMALRLSSSLMVGISRVYAQQYHFYYNDVNNAYLRLRKSLSAYQTTDLDMPVREAKLDVITLPNLPELDFLPDEVPLTLDPGLATRDQTFGWVQGGSELAASSYAKSLTSGQSADKEGTGTGHSVSNDIVATDHGTPLTRLSSRTGLDLPGLTDTSYREPFAMEATHYPDLFDGDVFANRTHSSTSKAGPASLRESPRDMLASLMKAVEGDHASSDGGTRNRKRKLQDLDALLADNDLFHFQPGVDDAVSPLHRDNLGVPLDFHEGLHYGVGHPARTQNVPAFTQEIDLGLDLFGGVPDLNLGETDLALDAGALEAGTLEYKDMDFDPAGLDAVDKRGLATGAPTAHLITPPATQKTKVHRKRALWDEATDLRRNQYVQWGNEFLPDLLERERQNRAKIEQAQTKQQVTQAWSLPAADVGPKLAALFPTFVSKFKHASLSDSDSLSSRPDRRQHSVAGAATGTQAADMDGAGVFAEQGGLDHSRPDDLEPEMNLDAQQDIVEDPETLRAGATPREPTPVRRPFPWQRETPSTAGTSDKHGAQLRSFAGTSVLSGVDDVVFEAPWRRTPGRHSLGGASSVLGSGFGVNEDVYSMPGDMSLDLAKGPLFDVAGGEEASLTGQEYSAERDAMDFLGYATEIMVSAQTNYVYFNDLLPPASTTVEAAASAFYHVLALATKKLIVVEQHFASEDPTNPGDTDIRIELV